MKKEVDYWEVEIKCIVKKVDINRNKVNKKRVEDDLSINFDQIDHEDLKVIIK